MNGASHPVILARSNAERETYSYTSAFGFAASNSYAATSIASRPITPSM
jgi:hypothetical protein